MDNPDTSETIDNKDSWQGSTKTTHKTKMMNITDPTRNKGRRKPMYLLLKTNAMLLIQSSAVKLVSVTEDSQSTYSLVL